MSCHKNRLHFGIISGHNMVERLWLWNELNNKSVSINLKKSLLWRQLTGNDINYMFQWLSKQSIHVPEKKTSFFLGQISIIIFSYRIYVAKWICQSKSLRDSIKYLAEQGWATSSNIMYGIELLKKSGVLSQTNWNINQLHYFFIFWVSKVICKLFECPLRHNNQLIALTLSKTKKWIFNHIETIHLSTEEEKYVFM